MLPASEMDIEITATETSVLDLSQLLGFRDLAGVGFSEAELAAALDVAHVKIGEFIPQT